MSRLACLAISGASWKALAPVPITATRLPASACWCCHAAEWKAGPANDSRPGMSGRRGRLSWPTALISALASSVSSPPSRERMRTVQRAAASSQRAAITSVPKRMRAPDVVAVGAALRSTARSSSRCEKNSGQSWLGSNE